MEARVGIEPTHKGFADLSLTAWVPRLWTAACWRRRANNLDYLECIADEGCDVWSGRPGSNRRHLPWQGSTLPLSYSRSSKIKYSGQVLYGQRELAWLKQSS